MNCLKVASRMRRIVLALMLATILVVPAVPAGAIAYDVTGHVYDTDTTLGLAGVAVTLTDLGNQEVFETVTDSSGNFFFDGLRNSDFAIDCDLGGYSHGSSTFIFAGTPQNFSIGIFELDEIAEGVVTDGEGVPLEGAEVTALYFDEVSQETWWVDMNVTGIDGAYALYDNEAYGAGEYEVVVWADGFEDESAVFNWDGSVPVTQDFTMVPLAFGTTPVEGENRFETAIAASQLAFPEDGTCGSVVVASGRNFPDALGGSALAGALACPVLLTEPGTLPEEVAAEIERLGATDIFVIGGAAAVSDDVKAALDLLPGTTVERISGLDRYETASLVAQKTLDVVGSGPVLDIIIATGVNFPDALAAAPLAAYGPAPILLVKPNEIPEPTMDVIDSIGMKGCCLVVGGEGAVGASVYDELEVEFGTEAMVRLAGLDRYETAAEIAQYGVDMYGLSWDGLAFATGANFPDALAGGAAQGLTGSPVLLTKPTSLEPAPEQKLIDYAADIFEIRYFGGLSAISDAVRSEIEDTVLSNKPVG